MKLEICLTNGIKYRQSSEKESYVKISADRIDQYLVLSFEDNGIGFDVKKHGHEIFGMYKTFHGNVDAKGIGLFITKNQIEAMGGKVSVESQIGEGTTFRVSFLVRD